MMDLILGREEVYQVSSRVWSFHRVNDVVKGISLKLSNMAGGFPFSCGGMQWKDSERLYLCGEFSQGTDEHNHIQQELVEAKSGYAAKRFIKSKYKHFVRSDFKDFRLQWMLYCVWSKCRGNEDFKKLLLSIPDNVVLLENTTTDNGGTAEIWGCRNRELTQYRTDLEKQLRQEYAHLKKKELERLITLETNKVNDVGEWKGQNNIGKILMLCRQALKEDREPTIDYTLLRDAKIHLRGKLLSFK